VIFILLTILVSGSIMNSRNRVNTLGVVDDDFYSNEISEDSVTKECWDYEEKVFCNYDKPYKFIARDTCKQMSLDPGYRLLVNTDRTGYGFKEFCYHKVSSTEYYSGFMKNLNNYVSGILSPIVLMVIFLELPIFFYKGFRTKKHLGYVILGNFISVPLVLTTLYFLQLGGILIYMLAALFVIIFESGLYMAFIRSLSPKQVLTASTWANVASTIIGVLLILFFTRVV
jgi:hypothetical protein